MKKSQPLFIACPSDYFRLRDPSLTCKFIGSLSTEISCTKGCIKSCTYYPSKIKQQPSFIGMGLKYTGIAFVKIEGTEDLCIGRFLCHEYRDGTHDQYSYVYKRGDEVAKKTIDQVFKDIEDVYK